MPYLIVKNTAEMFGKAHRIPARLAVTYIHKKATLDGKVRKFEEMPGPKSLPLLGNLWRYSPMIGEYSFERLHLTYAKMHEQYGPIVREHLFHDRILVHLFDPQDMRKVYDSAGFRPVRVSHRALAKYRLERPHLYSGVGLFPSNGEEWYRFRKLFQKILLSASTVEGCSPALEDVTDDLISTIPSYLDHNKETDLQPLLFCWALECIGVITLNRRLGCLSSNGNKEALSLVEAANETHTAIYHTENKPFSMKSYKKLETAQNLLSEVVMKYLDEALEDCKKGNNSETLLGKMVQLKDADKKDIFTMILDMFLAGIDTTAFSLSFALYNLAINKGVQDKLRAELMESLPTKNSLMSGLKSGFPYLKAVLDENLRVNPVSVGTGRILQTDLVLGGFCIPAKTMVILQHQVASLQKRFFENPGSFQPERWINREFLPLVSSPFGYGARMCIGKRLALKELHLAIAKIVRNYEIEYHYEKIDSVNRLINVPDKPLKLRLQSTNQ